MENDTIFNKSILCALALFGFSSATALESQTIGKVVVVGNFPEKNILIDKMRKIGQDYGNGDYDYDYSSPAHDCYRVNFLNGTGDRCFTAEVWNTASQNAFSSSRELHLHFANVVVLVSRANGPIATVNAELNYYFNEITNAVRDATVPPRTLVLLEEGGSPAIQAWCGANGNNLDCFDISTETGEGIAEACTEIGDRLAEQPPHPVLVPERQNKCCI
jgi:hypothetical protein